LSVFFWGISAAIQTFLPLLIVVSYLMIAVFVLGFLPAGYFKYLRPALSVYSLRMSRALALATWAVAFFIVIKAFGFLGVLLVLAFKLVVPIAVAGALLKGVWHIAGHLSLWTGFSYAMRYYSQWLSDLAPLPGQAKSRIIDVDAVAVKDH